MQRTLKFICSFLLFMISTSKTLAHDGHAHRINFNELTYLPNFDATANLPLNASTIFLATLFVLILLIAMVKFYQTNKLFNPMRIIVGLFMICLFGCFTEEIKDTSPTSEIMKHFEPYQNSLDLRKDETHLFVGSNGFPDHPMMVGIKAWQQQVPIPQPYKGSNAWRITLRPKLSAKPISGKKALYSGAIALAINGVPIFNALNNRGDDTYLAGELDDFGGHCGKGDDYHYHIAPVHLEKLAGKGKPIAYALDGFPIYGYTDSEGKEPADLDEFNGRMENDSYRYYSTKKFPYINGGLRGVVNIRSDRVDPQPRDNPIRPPGEPLRGAKITDFIRDDEKNTYTLKYDLQGKTNAVKYTINKDGTYSFVYQNANGKETSETYRNRNKQDDKDKDKKDKNDKDKDKDKKKKDDFDRKQVTKDDVPESSTFKLSSPAFKADGAFPKEFTGDGEGISPPLEWKGEPEGTKFYALTLWHIPGPGDEKSYWVIYNIPASVNSLPKNSMNIGKDGFNDKNRTGYDPMKSKGPGAKQYNITIYALSAEPKFNKEKVTRTELLSAIKGISLAKSTLTYSYERGGK